MSIVTSFYVVNEKDQVFSMTETTGLCQLDNVVLRTEHTYNKIWCVTSCFKSDGLLVYGAMNGDLKNVKYVQLASLGRFHKCPKLLMERMYNGFYKDKITLTQENLLSIVLLCGPKGIRTRPIECLPKKVLYFPDVSVKNQYEVQLCESTSGVKKITYVVYRVTNNVLIYGAGVWYYNKKDPNSAPYLEAEVPDIVGKLSESAWIRYNNFAKHISMSTMRTDLPKFVFQTVRRHGVRCKSGSFIFDD